MNSPITQSSNTKLVFKLSPKVVIQKYKTHAKIDVSKFFLNIDYLELWECLDTNYKFYYPFSLIGTPDFYENIQNTEQTKSHRIDGYYPKWKSENEFSLKFIKPSSKVLDIGCGEGNFLVKLAEMGIQSDGIEYNQEAVNKCKKRGLSVDIKTIEELKNEGKSYDVITLFQVLEHIQDINSFIRECLSILNREGVLIIGVPDNDPFYTWYNAYETMNLPPHHMGLWSELSLRKLSNYFRLEFVDVQHDSCKPIWHNIFFYCHFYASKITSNYGKFDIINLIIFPFLLPFGALNALRGRVKNEIHGETIVVALRKN